MENVCGISLQNLDFNLVEATLLSFETKTLTPIIKEELKLKIQSQRLAAGKQELPKPVFKEPEKCQVSLLKVSIISFMHTEDKHTLIIQILDVSITIC